MSMRSMEREMENLERELADAEKKGQMDLVCDIRRLMSELEEEMAKVEGGG